MKNIGHNRREGIEVLTLARPPANALHIETTEELADAFEALASDDAAAAVVLTGEGKAFCAGLDLKAITNYSQTELRRLLDAINRMATAVYSCPLPVIGAINGHAIAGGFVLAMCCDWKIVADAPMRVGLTEVRVGVPYPAAALEVVRSELHPKVARELVLFGKNMNAAEALAAGIFDESVAPHQLLVRAMEKAREAAELPRRSFKIIKHQLRRRALEACRAAVSGEGEALRDGWIQPEDAAAPRLCLVIRVADEVRSDSFRWDKFSDRVIFS
jgi:enoyl-CoA hydratase